VGDILGYVEFYQPARAAETASTGKEPAPLDGLRGAQFARA
jgi:hypothetical protein